MIRLQELQDRDCTLTTIMHHKGFNKIKLTREFSMFVLQFSQL